MTIPFQFPTIRPDVIQGGAPPDPNALFLQALLQGAQLGTDVMRSQEQAKIQREQLALEKAREKRVAEEQARQLAAMTSAGEALRTFITQGAQQDQARMSTGVQNMVAAATQAPLTRTAPISLQAAGPTGQLAGVLQGIPGASVPGVVESSLPLMQMAEGRRKEASRIDQINKAIATIPDTAHQQAMRGLVTFSEMGASMSDEMKRTLWPQLKTVEDAVAAPILQAAINFFETGIPNWGQVRRELRLPKNAGGLPDDARYPGPPGQKDRDTDTKNKAAAQLSIMSANLPFLNAYSERKAPGWLASWMKAGGGKGASLKEVLANPLLSQEDRQFLTGSRQFADAWVRVISGAQTNEAEFARILNSSIETVGDDPRTREYKRNMRMIMTQSVADIATGNKTPTQVLDDALRLQWSPQQRDLLKQYRAKAADYERKLLRGDVTIQATDTPTTPDTLTSSVRDWGSIIDQVVGTTPKANTVNDRIQQIEDRLNAPKKAEQSRRDSTLLEQLLPLLRPPGSP